MNNQQTGSKHMDLYRRLTLLILFVLFVIFTLVIVIIDSVGTANASSWIGNVQRFLQDLYPNIFFIPFTFLFGYLFFSPIQKADQEAQEKQLLENMKAVLLPSLEERFTEKLKELLVPAIQTSLTNELHVAASIQKMGIIAINPHIDASDLKKRMALSKDRVCISDTILYYNAIIFGAAIQHLHHLSLRILLLDPQSSFAQQRITEIYKPKGQLESMSNLTIPTVTEFYKHLNLKNLELRFHATMPAMQICIFDDEAIIGFYFYEKDSFSCIQIEVLIKDKNGIYTPFGKLIEEEFENRWNQAAPAQL